MYTHCTYIDSEISMRTAWCIVCKYSTHALGERGVRQFLLESETSDLAEAKLTQLGRC
jgi:hypothetical protein